MNPPNIPSHVLSAMWQFFLKTSVPELLEEKIKARDDAEKERQVGKEDQTSCNSDLLEDKRKGAIIK